MDTVSALLYLQHYKSVSLSILAFTAEPAFVLHNARDDAMHGATTAENPMRTGINHLFIPGPTNVPEVVLQAMNVPMQDQRAHDFPELTLGLFADLKQVFRTETGQVLLFPGSGTGA